MNIYIYIYGSSKVLSYSEIKGLYNIYIYFCTSFSFMLLNMFTETNVQEHELSDLSDKLR